jgi:hypothetical protein
VRTLAGGSGAARVELHCRTLATVATLERRFKYDARPDDKRRAHAGSDRADSGVGTAVAPVGETTRLPRFGFRAGFRNNLRLHKDITFIKLPPNCRRSPSEYLLRGSSTYLARARFRLKIALRSGGLARRVGRVDCNALRLGWGGTANPYRSSQQPNTSATRRAGRNPFREGPLSPRSRLFRERSGRTGIFAIHGPTAGRSSTQASV